MAVRYRSALWSEIPIDELEHRETLKVRQTRTNLESSSKAVPHLIAALTAYPTHVYTLRLFIYFFAPHGEPRVSLLRKVGIHWNREWTNQPV